VTTRRFEALDAIDLEVKLEDGYEPWTWRGRAPSRRSPGDLSAWQLARRHSCVTVPHDALR
jgi:hypothetical protein